MIYNGEEIILLMSIAMIAPISAIGNNTHSSDKIESDLEVEFFR